MFHIPGNIAIAGKALLFVDDLCMSLTSPYMRTAMPKRMNFCIVGWILKTLWVLTCWRWKKHAQLASPATSSVPQAHSRNMIAYAAG